MPILETEEYDEMWETSQEYQEILESINGNNVDADEIYEFLEGEQEVVDEAVNQLRTTGLIAKWTGYGQPYFRITSLGEDVLEYDDEQDYLEEMERREEEFEEVYSGDY